MGHIAIAKGDYKPTYNLIWKKISRVLASKSTGIEWNGPVPILPLSIHMVSCLAHSVGKRGEKIDQLPIKPSGTMSGLLTATLNIQ